MALTAKRIARLRNEPGRYGDGALGLYLQVGKNKTACWSMRYERDGRERMLGLGPFELVSIKQAREKAREARRQLLEGIDPIDQRRADRETQKMKALAGVLSPALALHERVVGKFAIFAAEKVTPAAYLYRHFEPNGGLLYVGITLSVLDRSRKHLKWARWRDQICLIVIEPFATREDALEAERIAIRDEYPKYNAIHNGHRQPIQELLKAMPRLKNRIAERDRECVP